MDSDTIELDETDKKILDLEEKIQHLQSKVQVQTVLEKPIEFTRIKQSLIDWIEVENDIIKLKTLNRYMLGIDGDTLEIQQLHELEKTVGDYRKDFDEKFAKFTEKTDDKLEAINKNLKYINWAIKIITGAVVLVAPSAVGELIKVFLH